MDTVSGGCNGWYQRGSGDSPARSGKPSDGTGCLRARGVQAPRPPPGRFLEPHPSVGDEDYLRNVAEMNMNEIIHTAVRRDLARFESALRAFPDGDRARAHQLRRAWVTLDRQLHHHHESEDAYVWPYVRDLGVVDPALLDAMESEHRAMGAGLDAVSEALAGLTTEPTADRAAAAADTVAESARVTDAHLVHEEQDVMPIIVDREQTPEWKAVERNLRKGGPAMAGELFAWLADGGDPRALASLRATVPPPVQFVLSRFFGRAYHREVAPVWRV